MIADPANAYNKVLAVKGNFSLKNVKITNNVIAGDTYAEHQAWEVTVTLPSDWAADDELVLLNVIPEKKKATDQGIKVVGTKVYYDQNGELVEISGVTLTPGGKYTFVREMDFTAEDAFTSNYYIYDGSGKTIGSAKKIAAVKMELPPPRVKNDC